MGQAMILGGLLVQIIFFGLFIITSIIFHRRMLKTPLHQMGTSIPWVKYLRILYFISALIICCVALNVFHPSKVVSGRQLDYRAPEDVEMSTGYQPAR
jgi:hypothetical protein